jgi:hypothetical protein
MRNLCLIAAFLFSLLPGRSQTTLREQLRQAGIPETSFSKAELDEVVDGTSTSQDQKIYFVYVRSKGEALTGYPHLVRYDESGRATLRSDLVPEKVEYCCGAPDGFDLTQDYLLISFHESPSANTVLVVDHQLRLIEDLYGFDFHEVGLDQVVFIEDMVHFAPQHQERVAFVDLRNGEARELYPPKGDPLRSAFTRVNQEHMPPKKACIETDNPCMPDIYDETIEFLPARAAGRFTIRVLREVTAPRKLKEANPEGLTQGAMYNYQHGANGWEYCEQRIAVADFISGKFPAGQEASCEPNLSVVADTSGQTSPLHIAVRELK